MAGIPLVLCIAQGPHTRLEISDCAGSLPIVQQLLIPFTWKDDKPFCKGVTSDRARLTRPGPRRVIGACVLVRPSLGGGNAARRNLTNACAAGLGSAASYRSGSKSVRRCPASAAALSDGWQCPTAFSKHDGRMLEDETFARFLLAAGTASRLVVRFHYYSNIPI